MGRHSAVAPAPEAGAGPDQTQPIPIPIPIPRQPLAASGPLPVVPPVRSAPAVGMPAVDVPAPSMPAPSMPAVEVPAPSTAVPVPRLLAGWADTGRPADLDEHLHRHGEVPRARYAGRRGAKKLVDVIEKAGLRGRGGAGFPTARKMAAVLASSSSRRRPVVVANGCEGDPTSGKDRFLLSIAPHLVLDGLALAAHAVGADQAILCVHRGSPLIEPVEAAIAERPDDPAQVHVVTVPGRYVASEASALVNFLTSGDARPTGAPPLPAERGVQGRPTLVDNVETLAHLALVARHGPTWFRDRGTAGSPGTTLVTMGGAVHRPGVYEVDLGTPAGDLLWLAGGTLGAVQAVLLGGLGGTWLPLPSAGDLPLAHEECRAAGAGLGVASLLTLPVDACGVAVTASVLRYLAGESAGQCGPCMFGLPALADDLEKLAEGSTDRTLPDRLAQRLGVIPGRGACAHPDGSVRLAASALRVFAADVAEHLHGRPCGRPGAEAMPVLGELAGEAGGWR